MARLARILGATAATLLLASSCALPDNFHAVDGVANAGGGKAGQTGNDRIGGNASETFAGNAGHAPTAGDRAGSSGQSSSAGSVGTTTDRGGGNFAGSSSGGNTVSVTGGSSNVAGGPSGGTPGGGSSGGNGTGGSPKAGQAGGTADGAGGTAAGNTGTAGSSGGMSLGGATGGANTGGSYTGGANAGGIGSGGVATGGSYTGGANAGGIGTGGTRPALLDNCSLLLHMDESSWNGTLGEAVDASGEGNHATAIDGATTSSNAKFGRGGYFDGIGYLSVADSPTLRPGAAFTAAAWIYPTALDGSASAGILAKRWGYGDRTAFALFLWLEYRLYVDIDGENDRFTSTFQFTNNNWYHVALVFDGTLASDQRARIYVNGNLDSVHTESSAAVSQYDSSLEVGRLRNGGDVLVGSLDEVAMWRRALTSDEIRAVFSTSSPL